MGMNGGGPPPESKTLRDGRPRPGCDIMPPLRNSLLNHRGRENALKSDPSKNGIFQSAGLSCSRPGLAPDGGVVSRRLSAVPLSGDLGGGHRGSCLDPVPRDCRHFQFPWRRAVLHRCRAADASHGRRLDAGLSGWPTAAEQADPDLLGRGGFHAAAGPNSMGGAAALLAGGSADHRLDVSPGPRRWARPAHGLPGCADHGLQR